MSDNLKDWTISREGFNLRLKQLYGDYYPLNDHTPTSRALSITLDTGWRYDLNLIERLRVLIIY